MNRLDDMDIESDGISEMSDISSVTKASSHGKTLRSRFRSNKSKSNSATNGERGSRSSFASATFGRSHKDKDKSSSGKISKLHESKSSDDVKDSESSTKNSRKNSKSSNHDDDGKNLDPAIRFAGDGVIFKAKLIGVDPVTAPRGDTMCKNAMMRLKAIVKGTGSHKQRILLSISLNGLKLMDEKTNESISTHPIPLISYISRDTSDSRAFGFVYGSPSEGHQFIGIKTEKQAIPVMQTIADLFTYVYEKRKKEKAAKANGKSAMDRLKANDSSSTVLSFSPAKGEEFSEDKVNAAWNSSEPIGNETFVGKSALVTASSTASPNLSMISMPPPPALPPPSSIMKSSDYGSRSSTMSLSQKSDTLAELMAIQHVINSASFATSSASNSVRARGSMAESLTGVPSTSSSASRYATWESFNETTSDSIPKTGTSGNEAISGLSATGLARKESLNQRSISSAGSYARPSSSLSSNDNMYGSTSMFQSSGIYPLNKPSSMMPLAIPSPPPSSPGGSMTGRPRKRMPVAITSFVQPNIVQLPPPHAPIAITRPPVAETVTTSTYTAPSTVFGFGSTPLKPTNEFEVNFDEAFKQEATASVGPSSTYTAVIGSNQAPVLQPIAPTFDAFPSSFSSQPAPAPVTKSSSSSSNDRYACFAEIQQLSTFSSIFDDPISTSANSDSSGTFVASPPTESPVKFDTTSERTEPSVSWSNLELKPSLLPSANGPPSIPPPIMPTSSTPPTTTQSNQDDNYQKSTTNMSSHVPSCAPTSISGSGLTSASALSASCLKDAATSPGTPPGSNSSQRTSRYQVEQDAFNMSSVFSELNSVADDQLMKGSLDDLKSLATDTEVEMVTSRATASSAATLTQGQVSSPDSITRCPSSTASSAAHRPESVASNASRNPFEDDVSEAPNATVSESAAMAPPRPLNDYPFDPFGLTQRSNSTASLPYTHNHAELTHHHDRPSSSGPGLQRPMASESQREVPPRPEEFGQDRGQGFAPPYHNYSFPPSYHPYHHGAYPGAHPADVYRYSRPEIRPDMYRYDYLPHPADLPPGRPYYDPYAPPPIYGYLPPHPDAYRIHPEAYRPFYGPYGPYGPPPIPPTMAPPPPRDRYPEPPRDQHSAPIGGRNEERRESFRSSQPAAKKTKHPTDFGPSFDFETDNFPSGSFSPTSPQKQAMKNSFSSDFKPRSFSPNNPFSPDAFDDTPAPVAPPRPPARTCSSEDAPAPPLPKRKSSSGQGNEPPPLPLPSRKKSFGSSAAPPLPAVTATKKQTLERKVSFDCEPKKEDPFDPFNVNFVDKAIPPSLTSVTGVETSTPTNVDAPKPGPYRLSTIVGSSSEFPNTEDEPRGIQSELSSTSLNQGDSSVFTSKTGSSYSRLTDSGSLNNDMKSLSSMSMSSSDLNNSAVNVTDANKSTSEGSTATRPSSLKDGESVVKNPEEKVEAFNHFGEDHISPPERNIFRPKDPFADDDFFS